MAAERPARVRRFTRTERAAHWILALLFAVMLATGVALLAPGLAGTVSRPTAKAWHLGAAVALPLGLLALAVAGNRRALATTLRDLDGFDAEDLRWLREAPARVAASGRPAPPSGRFNAGQKLAAAILGGGMVALYVTGGLLWMAERDTRFRIEGAVTAHDWVAAGLVVLVLGHVHKAVLAPATRASLRGMVTGEVDADWARREHPRWEPGARVDEPHVPVADGYPRRGGGPQAAARSDEGDAAGWRPSGER